MSNLFKSGTQTATNKQESNATSTTSGERTARQSNLFKEVLDQLFATISGGPQVMQADRDAMRGRVNKTFNAIAPRVESQLTSRGFGGGGKLGNALKGIDIARGNQIAEGESALTRDSWNRYAQMLGLALPFTRPDTVTTTSHGEQTGTQTTPGPSLFDKLLGYAGDAAGIASLFGFNPGSLFGGGGKTLTSGSGVGVNFGDSGDLFDLSGWQGGI
jgi:hypothetical protein